MSEVTVLHDNTSELSLGGLYVVLDKYPNATVVNVAGDNEATIDAHIADDVSSAQDFIFTTIKADNTDTVTAVSGTAEITYTNGGAASEIVVIRVAIGGSSVVIGNFTSIGGTPTEAALGSLQSINRGTVYHGFTATQTGPVLEIAAATSVGADANAYVLAIDLDDGGAIAGTVTTTFAAAATGVTGVTFTNAQLTSSQTTTLSAKASTGSVTELFTASGKNTPLVAWENIYSGKNPPRIIHLLGGSNVDSSDDDAVLAITALLPIFGGVYGEDRLFMKSVINKGSDIDLSYNDTPKVDIDWVRLLTGEALQDAVDNSRGNY